MEDVKKTLQFESHKLTWGRSGFQSRFKENLSELIFMIKLVAPLLWPRNHPRLQFFVVLSGFTLIANGVVNLYVPIYAQRIVDSMTLLVQSGGDLKDDQNFRWDFIIIFVILKICQGIGALGLITLSQQMLWLPLEQYVRHEIQVNFFKHLHNMSLTWMMHAKTGEILGALERGTESVASTVEHLIYSIVPTIADIFIAMIFLTWKFGWFYGLIVGVQITVYIIFTMYGIEKRSKFQSSINKGEDDLNQKVLESLTNFETVKCFGNDEFEKMKYSESLYTLQRRQFLISVITSAMQIVQLFIINVGLLVCSLLVVWTIIRDSRLTPGDYVLCTSFLAQLYAPLNYLGQYYRDLRVNLIKAKRMFDYFNEEPDIVDSSNAHCISANDGSVEFRNVSFIGDNGKVIIDNVSFNVAPKTTVALVGPSGSGKSSIVRLLLRLLEPTSGDVIVDGENIKGVTLDSLRSVMSIVPQDTILFNDTIRNNIRYGKLNATDYEVALAATAAQLHEKIMSFPDGYDTIVGERGTRLSGGERQRVAIARAILRDSKILILDEAMSALDSKTEKELQESLRTLCKNRTCIMITHKLSPAAEADNILVLKEGSIVESGKHEDLLARNGLYASMWKQQRCKTKSEVLQTQKYIGRSRNHVYNG